MESEKKEATTPVAGIRYCPGCGKPDCNDWTNYEQLVHQHWITSTDPWYCDFCDRRYTMEQWAAQTSPPTSPMPEQQEPAPVVESEPNQVETAKPSVPFHAHPILAICLFLLLAAWAFATWCTDRNLGVLQAKLLCHAKGHAWRFDKADTDYSPLYDFHCARCRERRTFTVTTMTDKLWQQLEDRTGMSRPLRQDAPEDGASLGPVPQGWITVIDDDFCRLALSQPVGYDFQRKPQSLRPPLVDESAHPPYRSRSEGVTHD